MKTLKTILIIPVALVWLLYVMAGGLLVTFFPRLPFHRCCDCGARSVLGGYVRWRFYCERCYECRLYAAKQKAKPANV